MDRLQDLEKRLNDAYRRSFAEDVAERMKWYGFYRGMIRALETLGYNCIYDERTDDYAVVLGGVLDVPNCR